MTIIIILLLLTSSVMAFLEMNESFFNKFEATANRLVLSQIHEFEPDLTPMKPTMKRVAVYIVGLMRNYKETAVPLWDKRLFKFRTNVKKFKFDIFVCTTIDKKDSNDEARNAITKVYEDRETDRKVRIVLDTGDLAEYASRRRFPEVLFKGTSCLRPTSYMFVRLKYLDYTRMVLERSQGLKYDVAIYLRPDVFPTHELNLNFMPVHNTLYFLLGSVRFRCFNEDRDYDLAYVGSPDALKMMSDSWLFHDCVSGGDIREYVANMPSNFSKICPENEPGHCYPQLNTGFDDAIGQSAHAHHRFHINGGRSGAGPRGRRGLISPTQSGGRPLGPDGKKLPHKNFDGSFGMHELPVEDVVHKAELGVWMSPFIMAYERGIHLNTAFSKGHRYFVKINRPSYYIDFGENKLPRGECLCCKVPWFTHGKATKPNFQPP